MRSRKRRFKHLLYGFRILTPDGVLLSEVWMNPDIDSVSMTSFLSGMPSSTGHCSIEQLYEYVKALPKSGAALAQAEGSPPPGRE